MSIEIDKDDLSRLGKQAFPSAVVLPDKSTLIAHGMSLRDYFAAQALAGMLAAPDNIAKMDAAERTHYAYFNADAMLYARDGRLAEWREKNKEL